MKIDYEKAVRALLRDKQEEDWPKSDVIPDHRENMFFEAWIQEQGLLIDEEEE